MKYDKVKLLKPTEFKRLTGIMPQTFDKMAAILTEANRILRTRRGRTPILHIEDQLLMVLKYWKEYPSTFSLAVDYGVSESTVKRLIIWVEDELAKSEEFHLPGKKALLGTDMQYEVFLVDATETPIERPKSKKKR